MKVAVSSEGDTLDAAVDARFGRSKQFILVDTESGEATVIDNIQNLNAAQGAGIQSAQTAVNSCAEAVMTGHCGPKAFRVLAAANVSVYVGVSGTVREAVAALAAGTIQPAQAADVEGHWA